MLLRISQMMSGSQGESTPNIGDTQQEVSENTLTYLIFTQDKSTDSRQVLRQLETVRQAALKLCSDLTADYIWQKDVFDLQLRTEGGKDASIIMSSFRAWADS